MLCVSIRSDAVIAVDKLQQSRVGMLDPPVRKDGL